MKTDYSLFELGDVVLQSGRTLPDAKLAYQTFGELNAQKDNVVLLPTFYTCLLYTSPSPRDS